MADMRADPSIISRTGSEDTGEAVNKKPGSLITTIHLLLQTAEATK